MLTGPARKAAKGASLASVRRASSIASAHKSPLVCKTTSGKAAVKHLTAAKKAKAKKVKPAAKPAAKTFTTSIGKASKAGAVASRASAAKAKARGC